MFVKSTFKEQAYEYLLNLIVNNQLEVDKVYSERHFAEIMGNFKNTCKGSNTSAAKRRLYCNTVK